MKKILYSVFALIMVTFTLVGCEDVPAPYDVPNDNPTENPDEGIEATGDGTLENPFNVAGAIKYVESLGADVESDKEVYIKGIVTVITENFDETGTYGNAEFYISDDTEMSNQFYCYRTLYLGDKKYTSGDVLKKNDEVIICGNVVNYSGNTPETVASKSYVYSLNGQTGEGGGGEDPTPSFEPEGDGTEANPFNSVAAYQYTAALGENETAGPVYIKGIVSQIEENYSTKFGNATYYISVDGKFDSEDSGNQFYIFRSLYLDNQKYTEGDMLSVGDEVVVYGTVTNFYGNTPETEQNASYLYSWKKGEGGDQPGGGEISGNSIKAAASDFGLDNAAVLETLTLSDGTTLTFAQNDGYNGPKIYKAGSGSFRMYPSNSVTVKSSKTIVGIEIKCDEYQGDTYNASGDIETSAGTINVNGAAVKVSGASTNSLTLTNTSTTTGVPSQFRIVEITIYYAE